MSPKYEGIVYNSSMSMHSEFEGSSPEDKKEEMTRVTVCIGRRQVYWYQPTDKKENNNG